MRRPVFALLALALSLGACQRLGWGSSVDPLPASPTQPVSSGALAPVDLVPPDRAVDANGEPLPPVDGQNPDGMPADGTDVASAGPVVPSEPAGSQEVGRTDMLGGWSVASGGDRCQLFMTLTTWSGGYRASTRGCGSATLKTISAWDLNGKQVILKDKGGERIATLYSSGAERFNGQTVGGSAISVSR